MTDNVALKRFELVADGLPAFADYRMEGGRIVFPHTVVPSAPEGREVGTRLVKAALARSAQGRWPTIGDCRERP